MAGPRNYSGPLFANCRDIFSRYKGGCILPRMMKVEVKSLVAL